jgi:hypothetical protein
MPKAGKLITWKLNFEIFEKSATSALTEHTLGQARKLDEMKKSVQ